MSLLAQCLEVYAAAPEDSSEAAGSALASVVSTLFANLILANCVTEALSALVRPLTLLYEHAAGESCRFSSHLQGKVGTTANILALGGVCRCIKRFL